MDPLIVDVAAVSIEVMYIEGIIFFIFIHAKTLRYWKCQFDSIGIGARYLYFRAHDIKDKSVDDGNHLEGIASTLKFLKIQ